MPPPMSLNSVLYSAVYIFGVFVVGYFIFLTILAIPFFQNQVFYLHRVTLTWFQDITVPEQWGLLRNEVSPFTLQAPDRVTLQAWHMLPL